MSSNPIIEVYGLLHASEIEVATSHSQILEIDNALRETEKHLRAAQASLKTALTFRVKEE